MGQLNFRACRAKSKLSDGGERRFSSLSVLIQFTAPVLFPAFNAVNGTASAGRGGSRVNIVQ
jgi:hypothetical protein